MSNLNEFNMRLLLRSILISIKIVFRSFFLPYFYQNRLVPRYINIATTRYSQKFDAGANNTIMPKRKTREKQEKEMPAARMNES